MRERFAQHSQLLQTVTKEFIWHLAEQREQKENTDSLLLGLALETSDSIRSQQDKFSTARDDKHISQTLTLQELADTLLAAGLETDPVSDVLFATLQSGFSLPTTGF